GTNALTRLTYLRYNVGFALACSPDGRTLAWANTDRENQAFVQLWDLATGRPIGRLKSFPGSAPPALAFSADGAALAAAEYHGGVGAWDLTALVTCTTDAGVTREDSR